MIDYIVLTIILIGAVIACLWLKRAAVQERDRLRAVREAERAAEHARMVAAVREALLDVGYTATAADADREVAAVAVGAKGGE